MITISSAIDRIATDGDHGETIVQVECFEARRDFYGSCWFINKDYCSNESKNDFC